MIHTARLRKCPEIFRRLMGIDPGAFDRLLSSLQPRYAAWREKELTRPDRQRRIGGGRPFVLELEDRLLMLLLYYRTHVPHAFLGFLFNLDDSNVGRNMNPLKPLLTDIFRIPERSIELSKEEIAELFFDGTEQAIHRPKRGQRKWYSGRKKHHTIKHQVVVVRRKKKRGRGKHKHRRRIATVSRSFPGRTHDKTMDEEASMVRPPGSNGLGDNGYHGTDLIVPVKKKPRRELTKEQRKHNIAHSRLRICVEHGIGKMETWCVLAERYRNPLRNHTVDFKNIAGLHNLMFA